MRQADTLGRMLVLLRSGATFVDANAMARPRWPFCGARLRRAALCQNAATPISVHAPPQELMQEAERVAFRSSSPDEEALVAAARDYGRAAAACVGSLRSARFPLEVHRGFALERPEIRSEGRKEARPDVDYTKKEELYSS